MHMHFVYQREILFYNFITSYYRNAMETQRTYDSRFFSGQAPVSYTENGKFPGFKSLEAHSVCEAKIMIHEEVTMIRGRENTLRWLHGQLCPGGEFHIECEQTALIGIFKCKC